jgi:acyl carrier protein
LRLPVELESGLASYRLHPALLDAGFQVLAAALSRDNKRAADASAYLAVGLDGMRFHASRYSPYWSHAVIRPNEQGPTNVLVADVRLLDEAGSPMVEIDGLRFEGLGGQASAGVAPYRRSVPPRTSRSDAARGKAPAAEHGGDAIPRGRRDGRPFSAGDPARGAAVRPTRAADQDQPFRERLRAAEPAQRQQLLESYLSRRLADVLGLGDAPLDVNEPLYTLGIDSLMVFKLGAQLEREVGIQMKMTNLLEGPSVSRLSAMLLSKMDES